MSNEFIIVTNQQDTKKLIKLGNERVVEPDFPMQVFWKR